MPVRVDHKQAIAIFKSTYFEIDRDTLLRRFWWIATGLVNQWATVVSTGQKSAEGFWYDQDENEWVVVLQGEAELQFADESELCCLKPGDSMNILAHRKHRVNSTSGAEPTIWLAVFYS